MVSVKESPSHVLSQDSLIARQFVSQPPSKKDIRLEAGSYIARLALTEAERIAAYRLRFLVFNLEINEGLDVRTWPHRLVYCDVGHCVCGARRGP